MKEKLPWSVLLVAALLLVSGGWGVVETVFTLAGGRLYIRFEFIGILLGHYLLLGREVSRFWTVLLSGVLLALTVLLTVTRLINRQLNEDVYATLSLILFGAVALSVFGALQTTSAKAWCQPGQGAARPDMRIASLLCVTGMIAGLALNLQAIGHTRALQAQRQLFRQSFQIDTRLFAQTSDGQPIKQELSFRHSSGTTDRVLLPTTLDVGAVNKDDNWTGFSITGKAVGPVEIHLSTKGYKSKSYTITNGSPSEVILTMENE